MTYSTLHVIINDMGDTNQNLPPPLRNRIYYYVLCVSAFAEQKNIPQSDAYNYLNTFKGIDFLIDCYDVEHTLSLDNAVEDLTMVCKNNGGTIE